MVLLFASLYFTKELHFSIDEAGLVMSFFGAGGILGSYAGGWLADRKNRLHVMLFSLVSSALFLLPLLIVTDPRLIAATIFCHAFTADLFRPANAAAIAQYSTPENRTRSISLVRLAVNLGFSVGPAAGGFIALHLGYKWLFALDTVTSIGAAVMLWFYLPSQPAEKKSKEESVLSDHSTSAYRDWKYVVFAILVALYGVCFFQIFASVPQFLTTQCNYHEDVIGLLIALNGFMVVVIEMPLVTALQKSRNTFSFIIAGAACVPFALILLQLGCGILIWAIMYIIIITISEILAMPFMMNYALSRPVKGRQGQYAALHSIAFGTAIMTAPLIGLGIAGKFGFTTMFYFFIALSIVVATGFFLLKRQGPHREGLN
jgi:predicted MFS family arabinose efflux permease